MEIKEVFIVRPTNNEQKEFIITVGKHLATNKRFRTKEEAENYIKYPKWDTTLAIIAEMIEVKENAKYAAENELKEETNINQNNDNN